MYATLKTMVSKYLCVVSDTWLLSTFLNLNHFATECSLLCDNAL